MSKENNGHPAWKPILDSIPESLHPLIKPKLEEWDKGVQTRFAEIHKQYEGFKPFMDNKVDPQWLQQAARFAAQFEQDPAEILSRANKTYELGFITPDEAEALKQQIAAPSNDDDNDDDFDWDENEMKLEDSPVFKQLLETTSELQKRLAEQDASTEEERAAAEYERYLDEFLSGDNAHVNRTFVTALMAQGFTGEQAVEEYNQALAGNLNVDSGDTSPTSTVDTPVNNGGQVPPVIMGSEGTAGAGITDGAIKYGDMSKNQLNETVDAIIKASQQNT